MTSGYAGAVAAVPAPATVVPYPLSLPWHVAYWADDPSWSHPADGGTVTTVRDGSGNGRTATAVNSPTWHAARSGFNGKGAIVFGSTAYMASAAYTAIPQPNTIVTVGKYATYLHDGDFSGGRHAIYNLANVHVTYYAGTGGEAALGAYIATPHLLESKINGASTQVNYNGTAVGLTGDPGTGPLGRSVLMTDASESSTGGGELAFYGVLNRAMTTPEVTALRAWAASYYGFTIA